MQMNKIVSIIILSTAFATPSFANYFANPAIGMNANVGSAPNPTPADLRGDRVLPQFAHAAQLPQHFTQVAASSPRMSAPAPRETATESSSTQSSGGLLDKLWSWLP